MELSDTEKGIQDSNGPSSLLEKYRRVRRKTEELIWPLEIEDMVIQSMSDTSPTRWHLAHVTWFFEQFVLDGRLEGFSRHRKGWDYLFNSYYYSIGDMYRRPQRGLLSRPTVAEVLEYRLVIDQAMEKLIELMAGDDSFNFLVNLGLNHEQQHQELILTDIKHALSLNPLKPAYTSLSGLSVDDKGHPHEFVPFNGGLTLIGANGSEFRFDNETPRHQVLLHPFELASRLVTNAEYREFIEDDGYQTSEWWLSDGWATILKNDWKRPIYWSIDLETEFSLGGEIDLAPNHPVCHLSYYEADAYARWKRVRLPTEAEWEHAASQAEIAGNLLDTGLLHPVTAQLSEGELTQCFGDVWEWTSSSYGPYPGFVPLSGSLGEYNGKFMCSQMVLRGGSCLTAAEHIRPSYRNFFYPDARWQFSGLRLARDS